ncbi:hypothetical protein AMQ84_29830 [Paenibacillus riograndensis]|uniref:CD-NTase associated protein 4-like DNA endonuclease domain-containing protein n=1 Tax=Paenibacillus riograndensis TaxID=483937 RepID=A0A132TGD1_9BACL|nr:hypothetical protein [Paenibacillus riograndensis]KWX70273.1 hypothetical protein AMQ84_29830 [Paenibacillus riograndensis]
MSAMQLSQENIDTNASASAFGWDFQSNAAILLALKNIRNLVSIKVEGKIEDIELYLEENKNIYVQAKSQENPASGANTLTKLKESLKTLINATNQENYDKLIYISNISNPFNNKKTSHLWGFDYIVYSYDELDSTDKKTIDKYVKSVSSSYNISLENLDLKKLEVCTFPFYGSNPDTRYRIIGAAVRRLLAESQISDALAQDLLDYWQNSFFQNASNRSVRLTKKDLIWPLIVLKTSSFSSDNWVFNEYDTGQIDEIRRKFESFINKKSEQFEFVTKVINDFSEFSKNNNYKNKEAFKKFINENWCNYSLIINNDFMDSEIIEGVIRLILAQVLSQRYSIDYVKKATGL